MSCCNICTTLPPSSQDHLQVLQTALKTTRTIGKGRNPSRSQVRYFFHAITQYLHSRTAGIFPALPCDMRCGKAGENEQPSCTSVSGRLEIVCFITALALVLGSAAGLWTFNLPIALIMLAAVYGVLRDVRALLRLPARNESTASPTSANRASRNQLAGSTPPRK